MFTRVTNITMMRSASQNLQLAASQLATAQNLASTQKTITVPSDDPTGTAAALQVRNQQKANTQYARNTADGNEWLTTVDSTLTNVTDLLQQATDLTIQGANGGTLSSAAKEAIATQLDTIRDSLLSAANTQYLGRNIFAGNSDAAEAFTATSTPATAATTTSPATAATTTYAYTGAADSPVLRRIDAGTQVRVDADGAAIFGSDAPGADGTPSTNPSVFAQLDSIANALRTGGDVSSHLTALAASSEAVLANQSAAGARQTTLITAASNQADQKVQLESQRSGIEDADLGEVVLELKMQENVYQASLAVTARALQPSLMDFLK
jgi:flagellar hook-associated protein 3 FlgL